MRHDFFLRGVDCVLALLLAHDRIGGAQVFLDEPENFLLQRRVVGEASSRGSFAAFSASLMMASITGCKCRCPNITAPSMISSDSSLASDSTIITASCVPAMTRSSWLSGISSSVRIEYVLVVDEADAGAADRTHERGTGKRQSRRRSNHRNDVRIVFHIVRQHGDSHLRVAAPSVGEQRADRAVDQTRGQRVLFGRSALTLEVAAGNSARSIDIFRCN